MGSQPSPLDNWISNGNIYIKKWWKTCTDSLHVDFTVVKKHFVILRKHILLTINVVRLESNFFYKKSEKRVFIGIFPFIKLHLIEICMDAWKTWKTIFNFDEHFLPSVSVTLHLISKITRCTVNEIFSGQNILLCSIWLRNIIHRYNRT